MPTITITADLLDPQDVLVAAKFLETVAQGGIESGFVKPGPTSPASASGATSGPTSGSSSGASGETATTGTGATIPASPSDAPKRTTKKDINVYSWEGEKLAGFTHSDMAAGRLILEVEKLKAEQVDDFAKHNMPSMARLTKEDAARVVAVVTGHVNKLREAAEEPAQEPTPPPAAEPATSDADLAALFKAPEPNGEAVPEMSKEDFGKGLVRLARALGPHESAAWLKKAGYEDVSGIPATEYAKVIAHGDAHIAALKG